VEFGSSSELDRVVSARSPSPLRLACARRIVPGIGSASPGVLAPLETQLRRVPLLTRTAARPSGKTKVAKPSSVPSSGFLPPSTVQAALAARHEPLRARRYRGTPTLRGLITCRSRLIGAALQSFPFPRSRSCSRRPLLPCGFASDYRQRGVIERFTIAFPVAPAPCLGPPGGGPRRMSRDNGSSRLLSRPPVSHSRVASRPAFPFTPGSPVSSRHARFEALLPPGVRSLATPCPGQGEAATSVLSWAFPL